MRPGDPRRWKDRRARVPRLGGDRIGSGALEWAGRGRHPRLGSRLDAVRAAPGARRRAERADDRVGRRRLRRDGRVRRPDRDADDAAHRRQRLRYSQLPHDRAVLADPLEPADGRNATSNSMACITEGAAGFPGFSARIPFENGTIAEVLNERGWNTYAIGKWHLTPGEESDMSVVEGPLAARAAASSATTASSAARRTSGTRTSSTTTTRSSARHAGGRLPPVQGPRRQRRSSSSATRSRSRPTSPGSCTSAPGCAHAPHHVSTEWSDRYEGRFDEGYEAIRARSWPARSSSGLLPTTSSSRRSTRTASPTSPGPDGQPWPQIDFVRPWDSLTATSSGCSHAWPRSTPASSPTPTTRSAA